MLWLCVITTDVLMMRWLTAHSSPEHLLYINLYVTFTNLLTGFKKSNNDLSNKG